MHFRRISCIICALYLDLDLILYKSFHLCFLHVLNLFELDQTYKTHIYNIKFYYNAFKTNFIDLFHIVNQFMSQL